MGEAIAFHYRGHGLEILGLVIIGAILCFFTLGLYLPWYVNNLIRYVAEHAEPSQASGGSFSKIHYSGTGAGLFGRFVVWWLLTVVTLGLYSPWAFSSFYGYIVDNLRID